MYGNVDFLGRYMENLLSLVALYDEAAGALPPDLAVRIAQRKQDIELDYLITRFHSVRKISHALPLAWSCASEKIQHTSKLLPSPDTGAATSRFAASGGA